MYGLRVAHTLIARHHGFAISQHPVQHFSTQTKALGLEFLLRRLVAQHQPCFVGKGKWDTLPCVLYAAQWEPAHVK